MRRLLAGMLASGLLATALAVPVTATEDAEKAACKDGGWEVLSGDYKNQGKCVAHVASGQVPGQAPEITYNYTVGSNFYSASATDHQDGSLPVTCSPPSPAPKDSWVVCSATDSDGNTTTISFQITGSVFPGL